MRTSHERRLNLNTWMSSLSGHPSLMSLCVYQTIVSGSLVCVSEMKLPVSLFLTPLLSGNQPRDRRLGFRPAGFSAAIPVLFLTSAIDLLAEKETTDSSGSVLCFNEAMAGISLSRSVRPLVKPYESDSTAIVLLRLGLGKENPERRAYFETATSLPQWESNRLLFLLLDRGTC